jgi:hypothetical protein
MQEQIRCSHCLQCSHLPQFSCQMLQELSFATAVSRPNPRPPSRQFSQFWNTSPVNEATGASSRPEVKNACSFVSTTPYVFMKYCLSTGTTLFLPLSSLSIFSKIIPLLNLETLFYVFCVSCIQEF